LRCRQKATCRNVSTDYAHKPGITHGQATLIHNLRVVAAEAANASTSCLSMPMSSCMSITSALTRPSTAGAQRMYPSLSSLAPSTLNVHGSPCYGGILASLVQHLLPSGISLVCPSPQLSSPILTRWTSACMMIALINHHRHITHEHWSWPKKEESYGKRKFTSQRRSMMSTTPPTTRQHCLPMCPPLTSTGAISNQQESLPPSHQLMPAASRAWS